MPRLGAHVDTSHSHLPRFLLIFDTRTRNDATASGEVYIYWEK